MSLPYDDQGEQDGECDRMEKTEDDSDGRPMPWSGHATGPHEAKGAASTSGELMGESE